MAVVRMAADGSESSEGNAKVLEVRLAHVGHLRPNNTYGKYVVHQINVFRNVHEATVCRPMVKQSECLVKIKNSRTYTAGAKTGDAIALTLRQDKYVRRRTRCLRANFPTDIFERRYRRRPSKGRSKKSA